jgi:hypothetical protein
VNTQVTAVQRTNRTGTSPSALLLLLLNAPLAAEALRKYLIHSDFVFFVPEALVLIVGCYLLVNGTGMPRQLPKVFWIAFWLYLNWALISEMRSGNPLPIFIIGLGTPVLPFFHLVVSVAYYRNDPARAISRLFWCASAWLVVIGLVAVAQVYAGQDSWFAQYGLGDIGNGDYSVDGRVVEGLFRPTSLFMHTGKFGQTIFSLTLFKLCVLFYRRSRPSLLVILLALWDLGVVIVSGQRSAFLFLTLSFAMLVVMARGRGRFIMLAGAVLLVVIFTVVATILGFTNSDVFNLVRDRYLSAFTDIPARIDGEFVRPIGFILNRYFFFGEGIGFYSIGAVRYGAKVIYDFLDEGGAENSWIRTMGEVGFVGFGFFFTVVASTVATGLKAMLSSLSKERKAVGAYLFLWLLSCMLWANTHDVFGNLVSMCVGFGLAGYAVSRENGADGRLADAGTSATARRFSNIY